MCTVTPNHAPIVGDLRTLMHRHGLRADRVRRMQVDCKIHRITAGARELQCRDCRSTAG